MPNKVVIIDSNNLSSRTAILQFYKNTCYLFLTKPNERQIDKDALAFMIKTPPKTINWEELKRKLPPYIYLKNTKPIKQ